MKRRSKDQQGKETQVERGVWESLVDTAQVLIVVLDTEGRIVLFNRACQETTGYSDEEVLGRNWFDLFLPERVKEGVGEVFQKLLAGQLPSHYENPILTKDGRERLIEWDNTFLRDEEGTVNYVIGTGRDITEYERAEGRILQQSAVLEAINKVFQETLVCVSDEDVARTCLAVAEELTGSKFGFIGEVNEAGRFDTIALSDPGWDACRIPRSNAVVMIKDMEIRGLWSRVLKNGQPLMVNDLASHPDSVGTPEGHPPLTAFLGVPLKYAGRTFGMIGVANKESGYDSTDQEALESLSVAFVEALMRKRAEEALKASQAYSRNIIDSSLDMIIAVDMDRHIVEFNKAAQETFGYRREEVLGVHVDILYADPQEGLRVHQEAIEKGQCVREILNRRKNGKVFPCLLSASVLRDARGELVGVMGVARDITERKRAEERLVKLHECFLEFGADPDENINRLVALCGEFLGATCALYNRLDGEMLYSVGQWNTPPDYNPVDKPEGRICYDVIKHGGDQVVVIRNLPETHYAQTDPNVVLYKLQTYVGQPVKFGSACVGSLCVVYQEDFVPSEEDKKLMEIVASAIGVEEKRKHAEEELRRSLEETAHSRHLLLALSRAAHAMQRARTPNEIYRTVGDEVTRLGYQATILVLTDDRTHLVMPHLAFEPALLRAVEKLTGLPAEDRRFPLSPDGIFQRIITEGEATFFEPITELIMDALPGPARPLAGRIVDLLGIEQGIVAPLAVGGEPHGLLVVTGVGLTEADVPAVTAFANQAAIAIENARLYQAERKRATQLAVVNQVARQAASILDPDQLLQEIVTAIQQGFDYYNVALSLLDEAAGELELRAIAGGFADVAAPNYRQAVGVGMVGCAAETGQPLLANDVRQEPRYIPGFLEEPLTKAELCVPLKLAGQVIGVLDIQSIHLNAFDETDLLAMETLADQIAVAIENARLFRETKRRFEETIALYQTSLDITAQLEMSELLKSIVERAVGLLRAETGGIYLYDPQREELRWAIGYGYTEKYVGVTLKPGEGLAGKVFQSGGPMILDDYRTWEGRAPVYEADQPFTAVLEVPLKWQDRIIGVLAINADAQKRTFNQDDAWLATLFANQAAVAIENARIYEQERKRATQLELIEGITQKIASILDLDELLTQVARLIGDTFGYYYTSILLVEAGGDELVMRAGAGPFGETLINRLRLKVGREGITGWVAHSGQPLLVNDVSREPRYYPTEESKDARSELAVPIKLKGEVIGVLDVQSVELEAFNQDDVSILQTLADQLAVAIENARLYEEAQRRAEQMAALRQMNIALTSTLERDQILEMVLDQLKTILDYDSATIQTLAGPHIVRVVAARPPSHDEELRKGFDASQNPLFYEMRDEKKAVVIDDVHLDDRWAKIGDWEHVRSWVGVPLFAKDNFLGFLNVEKGIPGFYKETEVQLLRDFAQGAALAIENARLFEAEAQRRQEAETLRQAAMALTSTLDLEEALDRILEQLHRVVAYDSASVQLLRDDHLEIVGGRGFADLPSVIGLRFPIPGDNPNTGVIESGEPVILADAQAAHAPFREPPHDHIRSWLGVPMRFHEQIMGMIALDSTELDHFTADHARLATAFANQAAVAIENARLFDEAERRLEEQAFLFEASAAASSTLNVDEVLRTLAERIAQAVDATSAYVCDWDEEQGTYTVLVEYFGPEASDKERVSDLGVTYSVENREEESEWLLTLRPWVDHLSSPDLSESDRAHMEEFGAKSILYLPLVAKGKAMGLIEVWESRRERDFTQEEIDLCQAIANQAAVAVENARLYEAERQQLGRLKELAAASQRITARLGMTSALEEIVTQALTTLEADRAAIFLLDRKTSQLSCAYSSGLSPEYVDEINRRYREVPGSRVFDSPEPIHILDAQTDPATEAMREAIIEEGFHTYAVLPLISEGERMGALAVYRDTIRAFRSEVLALAQSFANQAAIAIENARLYEQITALAAELEVRVQERTAELAHKAQELSFLYQASVALSSSLEVEEVLKALAQQAALTVDAVDCTIYELQDDALVVVAEYWDPALPWTDSDIGRRYHLADYPATREAIEKGQPLRVRVDDPLADEAERAELQEFGYIALLQVHIVSRDQVVGVVEVFDNKPEREFSEGDAALLQTIANQAGMAIEKARLFQQVRQERNRLELLYEVSRKLSASLDLEQALRDIFQVSVAATGASRGSIFVFDDGGRVAHRILMRDLIPAEADDAIDRVLRKGLAGWVLKHKQPTIAFDVSRDERWLPFPDDSEPVGSAMVTPFIERDRVRGLLTLVHPQPYHFNQAHLDLLSSIAHQVAVVIERARLHEQARRRAVQLTTAAEVSREATSTLDVSHLLTRTVDLIRERFDLYYVGIFLVDEAGQYAVLQAGTGEAGQQMLKQGHKLQVGGTSMVGWCVAHAQARIALDVGKEAVRFDNPLLPETRSEMALPIISRGRVIGAMTIQSDQPAAFSDEDVTTLQTLADQLANAIENAWLYEETRRRAREVAQQKEQTDAIVRSMADGLIVTNLENRLVLANPAAEELLGFRLKEAIGQDIGANIHDERLRQIIHDTLDKQQAGYEMDIELIVPHNRKKRIIRAHTAVVNDPAGQPMGIVTTLRDVTHEREVQRLKDELVGTVSHELRTPMASVLGFSELLLTRKLSEEKRQLYVQTIHQEARRLSALINDFLDIQRMERGQQEYHFEEVDLGELAREAVAIYSGQSDVHTLTLDLPPELPPVQADPDRLRRVFGNLLSNAIKFSPAGGTVAVSVQAEGDEIHVAVSDEGIGIPAEALPHIFEKFFRVDSSDRREIKGTGLGLAICKGIVEAHGGRIWAESQEGVGTTVTFSLPLMVRKRILVIDDEEDIRDLFQRLLGERSYEVLTAANGQEGLSLMEAELPDLVILDIAMPVMDGYQFLEKMKGDRRTKGIPVIAISGVDTDVDRLKELGADEFLSKPFSGTVLLETMQRLLKDYGRAHSSLSGADLSLAKSSKEVEVQ